MQIRTEDDHYVIEFFNGNTSTEHRLTRERLIKLRERINEIFDKEKE